MRAVRIMLLAMGLAFATPALAEPVTAEQQLVVEKSWTGTWTGGGGYIYSGVLTLSVGDDGAVDGAIAWTLRRVPPTNDQSRVGESAVESVSGAYSPTLGAIALQGYAASDETLIGLDLYRLVLAEDGSRIVGITEAGGGWDGRIEFTPEDGV